jgi:hypothetical protein
MPWQEVQHPVDRRGGEVLFRRELVCSEEEVSYEASVYSCPGQPPKVSVKYKIPGDQYYEPMSRWPLWLLPFVLRAVQEATSEERGSHGSPFNDQGCQELAPEAVLGRAFLEGRHLESEESARYDTARYEPGLRPDEVELLRTLWSEVGGHVPSR